MVPHRWRSASALWLCVFCLLSNLSLRKYWGLVGPRCRACLDLGATCDTITTTSCRERVVSGELWCKRVVFRMCMHICISVLFNQRFVIQRSIIAPACFFPFSDCFVFGLLFRIYLFRFFLLDFPMCSVFVFFSLNLMLRVSFSPGRDRACRRC